MQRISFLLLLIFSLLANSLWAGKWEMYKVIDTIPIKKISKKKVFNEIEDWFKKERNTRLVRENQGQFVIEGKSFFVYYNHVQIEDVFLSPRANERTTGNMVYQITVQVYDSIVIAECSNFTHEANYSQYGSISFAQITDYETVPPGRCLESKNWCNLVWADLKAKAKERAEEQIGRMLPESMIRKKGKVFKADKENVIDTTPVKIADPKDYLNIENYLIKDGSDKKKKSVSEETKKKKKKKEKIEEPAVTEEQVSVPDSLTPEVPEPTYESVKKGMTTESSSTPNDAEKKPNSETEQNSEDAVKKE